MKINDKFVLRNIYGKAILMPIKRNKITDDPIFFNPVGERILLECGYAKSPDSLLKRIVELYGIEDDIDSVNSVKSFIEDLISTEIITE